jgi:hypothetical protein
LLAHVICADVLTVLPAAIVVAILQGDPLSADALPSGWHHGGVYHKPMLSPVALCTVSC